MSYMVVTCQWCGEVYDFGVVGTIIIGTGHTCQTFKTCATPGCEQRGRFLVYENVRADDPVLIFACGEHIEDRIIAACQPGVA